MAAGRPAAPKGQEGRRLTARTPARRALVIGASLAGLVVAGPAGAQFLTRPRLAWTTLETPHFAFHTPTEMQAWTRSVAERMESIAASVNALVGNAPAARITVVVEDPSGVSNGFALPFLEGPVIFLWPTPPTPAPTFGAHRDWGELLAVHEYAHIAHLTIPSRDPNERRLWRLLPTRIGPVARRSPMWVIEGYATLIEGRLTGDGRPASVGRAAVLREWALEGKLPTYGQLDNAGPFFGGSMRYLVGSAFLEWLESQKGDSSLAYVWRRLSARQQRSFSSAFAGVFGAPPEDMYGRFFVEVTASALEARRRLVSAGVAEGTLVQKLNWATGEPAISPDGQHLAVVLRSPTAPSRLVVLKADEERDDSVVVRARRAMLARDPLDVPAFDSFPRPRRVLATLRAVAGRSFELPRWLPDGQQLLVSHDEPMGDGATRPDLFVWNVRSGRVRRLTRGAGIRYADPSPDGASAAAIRCADGRCDLTVVELATGRWRTLAPGAFDATWYRPRWSPDGTRIAASYQSGGRWRVAVVDARTGDRRFVDPSDGASRYAASWTTTGTSLVVVSELGGVANLERLDLSSGVATTLTRVLGGVTAPDVSTDGTIYFLSLHAKGYDIRRLPADSAGRSHPVVALDAQLFPVAPGRFDGVVPAFPAQPVSAAEYGLGPRYWRALPGLVYGADGGLATVMLGNIDPIARLSLVAQGGYGERGAWRGGSLGMALRRLPADIRVGAWSVAQHPSQQRAGSFASPTADLEYTGLALGTELAREQSRTAWALRGATSIGTVHGALLHGAGRALVFGEARGRAVLAAGEQVLSVRAGVQGTAGQTDDETWRRLVITEEVVAGTRSLGIRASATQGTVAAAGDGDFGRRFEQFLVGGSDVPFVDRAFLSQRVALPGVPVGFISGRRLGMYRLALLGFEAEPFISWVAAGDSLTTWRRLLGLERAFSAAALGFARLPEVSARVGATYSMDEPYRRKTRLYAGVFYRP